MPPVKTFVRILTYNLTELLFLLVVESSLSDIVIFPSLFLDSSRFMDHNHIWAEIFDQTVPNLPSFGSVASRWMVLRTTSPSVPPLQSTYCLKLCGTEAETACKIFC